MSSVISLNASHVVQNGYNNTLRYNLGGSAVNFTGTEVALQSIQLYNSQFNITSDFGNNVVSTRFPIPGGTTVLHNFTIPDGYYSYDDLNNWLQLQMISAGCYLIDADGNNVFYIRIRANPTYYACQIDCHPVPNALPAGWTRPATGTYSAGGSGLPPISYVPRIVLTKEFGALLGFTPSAYPIAGGETNPQVFLSNITPQINPISSYLVRCNLVNNSYSNPPDVLTSFNTQGTTIGQQISVNANEHSWLEVANGARSYIEIIICDQNGNYVKFMDSQINILLLLRQRAVVSTTRS